MSTIPTARQKATRANRSTPATRLSVTAASAMTITNAISTGPVPAGYSETILFHINSTANTNESSALNPAHPANAIRNAAKQNHEQQLGIQAEVVVAVAWMTRSPSVVRT